MIVADRDYVKSKYNLLKLKEVEDLVAGLVQVNVPFNNYITGAVAFTHKAGIHAKAILASPSTYEILNPEDFGIERYIHFASRVTGWHSIAQRASQLRLHMTEAQIKIITAKIKALADIRPIAVDDCDSIIRGYYSSLKDGVEKPLLPNLTEEEKVQLAKAEKDLAAAEPEKRALDNGVAGDAEVPAKKIRVA